MPEKNVKQKTYLLNAREKGKRKKLFCSIPEGNERKKYFLNVRKCKAKNVFTKCYRKM